MEQSVSPPESMVDIAKRLAQRLLTIGGNRIELFMAEVQEERERLLHAILLAAVVGALSLLCGITFTATVVACLWSISRAAAVVALVALTALYAVAAVILYRRLAALLVNWQSFPSTLDQLRKDSECLQKGCPSERVPL